MKTQDHRTPPMCHSIGAAAQLILSNSQHGSVLGRVTGAVYLQNESGELCWLVPAGGARHQRSVQLFTSLPGFVVGSEYKVNNQKLVTSSGETLDFKGARIWTAPSIALETLVPLSRSYELLFAVIGKLLAGHAPSGLGGLIPVIVQISGGRGIFLPAGCGSTIAEKAWPLVKEVIQTYQAMDNTRFINSVKSLVGFGEGLTPSGDDFLGGFLFAARLLDQYHPNHLLMPVCTYLDFILQSKSLTNLISYTILKDHANGQSVEPLHQLSHGLLLGEPEGHLYPHAEKMISIGHSTGWDLLTGFVAGISSSFTPEGLSINDVL